MKGSALSYLFICLSLTIRIASTRDHSKCSIFMHIPYRVGAPSHMITLGFRLGCHDFTWRETHCDVRWHRVKTDRRTGHRSNGLVVRVLTDRQTDKQTHGTDNITSSANTGGKYAEWILKLLWRGTIDSLVPELVSKLFWRVGGTAK